MKLVRGARSASIRTRRRKRPSGSTSARTKERMQRPSQCKLLLQQAVAEVMVQLKRTKQIQELEEVEAEVRLQLTTHLSRLQLWQQLMQRRMKRLRQRQDQQREVELSWLDLRETTTNAPSVLSYALNL